MAIASLVVNLKAQTASFSSAMQKAAQLSFSTGKDIERSMGIIGKAAAAAGVAVAGAMAVIVKHQLEVIDHMGKLAQSAGTTVETFSALAYAAKLSDVDIDQLAKGLGKLSKSMLAATDDGSDMGKLFKNLGIDVKDSNGGLRESDEVLRQLATKFQNTQDGALKTALAIKIFGRAGADLIPFLNQGGDGIKRLKEEAEKLGIVIDEKTFKAAEKFNDTLKTMHKTIEGMELQFTAGLVPALNQVVESFFKVTNASQGFKGFGEAVGTVAIGIAKAFAGAAFAVSVYALKMEMLKNSATKSPFQTLFGGGAAKENADIERQIAALTTQYGEFLNKLENATPVIDKVGKSTDDLSGALTDKLGKAFVFAGEKAFDAASMFDLIPPSLRTLEEQINRLPLNKHLEIFGPLTALDPAIEEQWRRAAEIIRDNQTPLEVYNKTLEELGRLLATKKIEWDVYNRAVDGAAQTMKDAQNKLDGINQGMKEGVRAIGHALEDAVIHMKGIKGILAGLLEDIARIFLRLEVTKPLEGFLSGLFGGGGGGGGIGGFFSGLVGSLFGGGGASSVVGTGIGLYGAAGHGDENVGFVAPNASSKVTHNTSGGSTKVYNIDARGADAGVEHAIMRAIEASEDRAVRRSVATMGQLQFRRA